MGYNSAAAVMVHGHVKLPKQSFAIFEDLQFTRALHKFIHCSISVTLAFKYGTEVLKSKYVCCLDLLVILIVSNEWGRIPYVAPILLRWYNRASQLL